MIFTTYKSPSWKVDYFPFLLSLKKTQFEMKTRVTSDTSPRQFNSVLQSHTLRDACYWRRATQNCHHTRHTRRKSRPAEFSTTTPRCVQNCSRCFQQPLQFLSCCDRPFQSWPGRGLGGLVNLGNSLRVARFPHSPGKYIPTKKKIILPFYVSSLVGSAERPY